MDDFFTVDVYNDFEFKFAVETYIEQEETRKEHVCFVVRQMVSTECYRNLRNWIITNNLSTDRCDKILNPRPIGCDETPPRVMILNVEELKHQIEMRGEYFIAELPRGLPKRRVNNIQKVANDNRICLILP
ncbi:hypothetical protein VNO77_17205 [Canavalia gladiata]|uniref:Uncharacterized protein n=1 Tax=Canavalia gladiata TaxID=3824 RepID=A0AAN9LIM8_CANGL